LRNFYAGAEYGGAAGFRRRLQRSQGKKLSRQSVARATLSWKAKAAALSAVQNVQFGQVHHDPTGLETHSDDAQEQVQRVSRIIHSLDSADGLARR